MAAVWKHTIQGDPRREDLVQPYKRVPVKEEDQDPDFRALASLGLGMAGLFTKNQYFSWGALFSAVSALCCMEHPEVNMKQATTALMFSLSGLASSYIRIYQMRGAPPKAE
ncbi:hypothetical protein HKI87_16g81970 [Chloropicon roscoffensis]|uniref:Uncharacterized protein n=1 Tax=Chloropicon roscoffensis TaxID=1461544 RepID=A0AAX4PKT5_9CHLO